MAIQTPRIPRDIISSAYAKMYADTDRGTITDDAMLVERYTDVPVKMAGRIHKYKNYNAGRHGDCKAQYL